MLWGKGERSGGGTRDRSGGRRDLSSDLQLLHVHLLDVSLLVHPHRHAQTLQQRLGSGHGLSDLGMPGGRRRGADGSSHGLSGLGMLGRGRRGVDGVVGFHHVHGA